MINTNQTTTMQTITMWIWVGQHETTKRITLPPFPHVVLVHNPIANRTEYLRQNHTILASASSLNATRLEIWVGGIRVAYNVATTNGTRFASANIPITQPGVYQVEFRAQNSAGLWTRTTRNVTVRVRRPEVYIGAHNVASSFYHTSVMMIVFPGCTLWNHRYFSSGPVYGRGGRLATIGAGPEVRFNPPLALISRMNRSADRDLTTRRICTALGV